VIINLLLVACGWWLVAGGWWLVAGGWWLVAENLPIKDGRQMSKVSRAAGSLTALLKVPQTGLTETGSNR